jgi:hypothetical protein
MDDRNSDHTDPLEVPDHLVDWLRLAAEDELERACDNGGEWDDEIRTLVLDAARVVEIFDIGCLGPAKISKLAMRAVHLLLDSSTNMGDIPDAPTTSLVCRELIALRDAAHSRAEHLGADHRR